jgi:NAD(P)-dependent dehydrogenase (short-subunit alcohol dehydrogenase family)
MRIPNYFHMKKSGTDKKQFLSLNRRHETNVDDKSMVQESLDPEQARRDFIARQRMGRLGTPEEIAHLVVYLAADEVSRS